MKSFAIIGPTATGKSKLALEIALQMPIEIINMDSAQIYKQMDIGTAKPSSEEQKLVPHHLINIIYPNESYNVANFIFECKKHISEINNKNKIALIVGGTMMYYNSLLNGISELPKANENIRNIINNEKEKYGLDYLYKKLYAIDSFFANKIKKNDYQRIQRALEVFMITNKPISYLINQQKNIKFNIPTIAIIPESRDELHKTISIRFLNMIKNGFIEEVENLKKNYPELNYNYQSLRCIGYKQAWDYLDNKFNKKIFIEKAIIATRQLAKRQITWLRKLSVPFTINPLEKNINTNKIKDFIIKN